MEEVVSDLPLCHLIILFPTLARSYGDLYFEVTATLAAECILGFAFQTCALFTGGSYNRNIILFNYLNVYNYTAAYV